jgi:hypothetical protein
MFICCLTNFINFVSWKCCGGANSRSGVGGIRVEIDDPAELLMNLFEVGLLPVLRGRLAFRMSFLRWQLMLVV